MSRNIRLSATTVATSQHGYPLSYHKAVIVDEMAHDESEEDRLLQMFTAARRAGMEDIAKALLSADLFCCKHTSVSLADVWFVVGSSNEHNERNYPEAM